jgi:hypothetical protein
MNLRNHALNSLCSTAAASLLAAVISIGAVSCAQAESEQISDQVVERLVKSQWDDMPTEITNIPGEKPNEYLTATVDRDKHIIKVQGRDSREVKILPDDVREVVRATYRARNAAICGLKDESKRNWMNLMGRFTAKEYYFFDIYFLNQLYNRYLARLGQDYKAAHPNDTPCTAEQKAKVTAQIEEYLKANPIPEKTAAANK